MLLVCSTPLVGQIHESPPKLTIKISPLGLIDVFDASSLRFGAEIKLFNGLSFDIEAGKYIGGAGGYKLSPQGHTFRPSLKYYIADHKNGERAKEKSYFAIEYFYKNQTYNVKDSIRFLSTPSILKTYKIERKIHAFSAKYGRIRYWTNKIIFEYYFGLGIRFTTSESNLSIQEEEGIIDATIYRDSAASHFTKRVGDLVYLDITAGIKIGFILF